MIFKFRIISDKVENFVLHILADANSTFFELHEAIQDECRYDPSELSTFYLADEEWDRGLEIPMFINHMPLLHHQVNMKGTKLGDLLFNKEDKLIYVFDIINQKSLYVELIEIVMDKELNSPIATFNRGIAPSQNIAARYDNDLLIDDDVELQNIFTDFGELEDLNLIYGEIGEVI